MKIHWFVIFYIPLLIVFVGQVFGEQQLTGVVRLHESRPQFMAKSQPNTRCYLYRWILLHSTACEAHGIAIHTITIYLIILKLMFIFFVTFKLNNADINHKKMKHE